MSAAAELAAKCAAAHDIPGPVPRWLRDVFDEAEARGFVPGLALVSCWGGLRSLFRRELFFVARADAIVDAMAGGWPDDFGGRDVASVKVSRAQAAPFRELLNAAAWDPAARGKALKGSVLVSYAGGAGPAAADAPRVEMLVGRFDAREAPAPS